MQGIEACTFTVHLGCHAVALSLELSEAPMINSLKA